MTPLALLAAAGPGARLVARPTGVAHAYVGPLTPSGRRVPRAGRTVCNAHTRTLSVVHPRDLYTVRRRRVCGRCVARLTSPRGGAGPMTRAQLRATFAGVTAVDIAFDASRARTVADVELAELLALVVVGLPAAKRDPVTAPDGTAQTLDRWIAQARRRVAGVRDPLGPTLRAAAVENEHEAREARRLRGRQIHQDREAKRARLGFDLASRTA